VWCVWVSISVVWGVVRVWCVNSHPTSHIHAGVGRCRCVLWCRWWCVNPHPTSRIHAGNVSVPAAAV
jgi:hypothetical protein